MRAALSSFLHAAPFTKCLCVLITEVCSGTSLCLQLLHLLRWGMRRGHKALKTLGFSSTGGSARSPNALVASSAFSTVLSKPALTC